MTRFLDDEPEHDPVGERQVEGSGSGHATRSAFPREVGDRVSLTVTSDATQGDPTMSTYDKLYIDGAWVAPAGTDTLEVIDSTTEEVFATIPAGAPADIDRAVAAAKAAFPGVVGGAGARARQVAAARRRGARGPARRDRRRDHARGRDAEAASRPRSRSAPASPRSRPRRSSRRRSSSRTTPTGLVVREPIGVVGCITPWNYPLNQIGAKVAYALAAGCTVVLKPSEVAPVNAFILAEIIDDIGFPPGVFNLVTGRRPGRRRGARRASRRRHDLVHRLHARRTAGRRARRARRSRRSRSSSAASRRTSCSTTPTFAPRSRPASAPRTRTRDRRAARSTRMIVPRSRLAEVEQIARETAESYTVGDPVRRGHAPRTADLRRSSATACAATSRRASRRAPTSSPVVPTRPTGSTPATS